MSKPMAMDGFTLWATDWLSSASIMQMTAAGEGAYIRLLCWQWQGESLPADERELRRLSRLSDDEWEENAEALLACLPLSPDGRRRNIKLERERNRRAEFVAQQRARGKKGNLVRWKDRNE